jgi:ABC-type branched-subunit amino acid transport system substrate-binding protein
VAERNLPTLADLVMKIRNTDFRIRVSLLYGQKKVPMKKPFTATVTLLTISLLLVSCGGVSYQCTDPLGCLEISPSSPVVIGTILATNGEQGPAGTEALQSVEKAMADKDELLGHPIQLDRYGTDCTADSARVAATEFATYTDLSAVIGPTCTDETVVASPILLNAGIPLLSPVPNSVAASEMGNQVFAAIEQVAVQMPDQTLYIPRQALLNALHLYP